MRKQFLAVLLLFASCKTPSPDAADSGNDIADLADPGIKPPDLRRGPDLTPAPPDLSATCRGRGAPGIFYQLATDAILLPKTTGGRTYALDYDGDGKPENQLKNLANVIALAGLDLQSALDAAVASGDGIELFGVSTLDPSNSTCVGVEGNLAKPPGMGTPRPKFDGSDVFFPDMGLGAQLTGMLTAGQLSTTVPPRLSAAEEPQLLLRLALGGGSVLLPLRGVHIEGTLTQTGGVWRIQNGVLHGVITKTTIDTVLVPLVANILTELIHKDTVMGVPGDTAKAVIGLFETKTGPASIAKCMVPVNCCRVSPETCFISPAEVTDSSIGGVLAPDVQVLDTGDHWAPVPGGRTYNAMSFGIGFTAVTATY